MTTTSQQMPEHARIVDLQLEVTIRAAPAAVWQALTNDIGKWWPGTFFCGAGSASRPSFHLEARPGGRMWEDHGNGEGLLWATVVNVVTNKTLDMNGAVGPAWGGPCSWFGGFALEADGPDTKLRFAESGFGRISDATMSEKEKGWKFLLATLGAHLEGSEPPVWEGGC